MLRRHTKVTTATQASYLAAAAKFALLFAACLAFQALSAGQPLVIQSVTISGTGRPLELETKAGELLERARVARDVKRLWATGRVNLFTPANAIERNDYCLIWTISSQYSIFPNEVIR